MDSSTEPVRYAFTVSFIFFTYQGYSEPFRPDDQAVLRGLPYTLISLVLGWWGFPWGPIRTIQSLIINFGGGEPVRLEGWQSPPPQAALAAGACPSCYSTDVTRAFGKGICNQCKTRW